MEKIEVQGATVDFFKSIEDGLTTYHFDTSRCGPPEPMVNAMAGLQLLDENSQLVMINHKSPAGLFPKVEEEFNYFVEELDNGFARIIFRKKVGSINTTDFTQNSCSGSGCNH
ncbi:hypothetical protein [Halarcobacter bivalviorum]|uniref:DUF2249 domain-containing protein n=1 Tax=Halarcobacter bivalviorum TaxID=663364 RepID=A0AAX2A4T2_9BACT|nr:hypothetical protein [Halarcobacter bivalviorum]AXH12996.1 hypothetical protein ABIV_2019 [Halarcobacter bivalviorum]RXK09197.1 hypothetical protein CRV05_11480 [Halarcobacter bivalviorum]